MSDLELLITGAMVTFLAVAGAYVAIRQRANELPVDSYKRADGNPQGLATSEGSALAPLPARAQNGALHSHADMR